MFDLHLSAEQLEIRDTVREFVANEIKPVAIKPARMEALDRRPPADVLEKALYNTVVSGIARDGRSFFYVNPLEVQPSACGKNHIYDHVKPSRQGWFGCACCPPNIARLLASLGRYIYSVRERTVYTHLYIGGDAEIELDGDTIGITQHGRYVADGETELMLSLQRATAFTLALRIPEWSDGVSVSINGSEIREADWKLEKGYLLLDRRWNPGDAVRVSFEMPVRRMKGHPSIRHTASKAAIQRGPFIYCLEEADNGPRLHEIVLPRSSELRVERKASWLGGLPVIRADAIRLEPEQWNEQALYKDDRASSWTESRTPVTFIPYFAWANRECGEMAVWVKDR